MRLFLLPLLLVVCINAEQHAYDKVFNELTKNIELAEEKGSRIKEEEKQIKDELYYQSEWERDLEPFQEGITEDDLRQAEQLGNKYQIVNHKLYRKDTCIFEARCKGIDHFLNRLAPLLDDTELYINEHDHPKAYKRNGHGPKIPLFSFSKKDSEHWDILYPAWSFHSGGPAIETHPTGIGNWSGTADHIYRFARAYKWEKRAPKGFFLGSRTNDQRDELVLLSRQSPELVDAQFTKNQGYRGPEDTLNAEPAAIKPFTYNCKFKFVFNFRGIAASFRYKHLLLCGSTVMHVEDGWREFFYNKLIPYYHYIPVMDNSRAGITKLLHFGREHDEWMKAIGERGQAWIQEHLRIEDVDNYWLGLLKEYTKLLRFKVQRDPSLKEIKK